MPIARNYAEIVEEVPGKETGGHYGVVSLSFDAATGLSTHDFTTKIPVAILAAYLPTAGLTNQDRLRFSVAPDTIVGAIGQNVGSGLTDIPMPQSVMDLFDEGTLYIGQEMKLDDGTNADELGIVKSVDQDNNEVTVETATTNSFLAATPTYIKITTSLTPAVIGDGWHELTAGTRYEIGLSKIGSSRVDENKIIRIEYDNQGGGTARVNLNLEVLY